MSEFRTPELNAALAAAQGEFPAINKDKTAKAGNYSYNYASLDVFLNACRPKLAKHGIALSQVFDVSDGLAVPTLRTELRHTSGEVISSVFPLLRIPETDQQLGSMLTYLRRYTLAAMLGVAAEEDDDGQQASSTPATKTTRKQPVVPEGHPNADPKPEPAEPATPGHTVLTFGKYKGLTIADVAAEDRRYVGWLAHEASNEKVKAAAAAFLHDDDIPF